MTEMALKCTQNSDISQVSVSETRTPSIIDSRDQKLENPRRNDSLNVTLTTLSKNNKQINQVDFVMRDAIQDYFDIGIFPSFAEQSHGSTTTVFSGL